MRRRAFFFILLGVLAVCQTPAISRAAEQQQILFYLDANRLITLNFQVTVDGKSFREVWETHLDQQFKKIDKNQDGKIAGEERDQLPNTRILRGFNQAYTFRAPPATMDRKAFEDYIEKKLEFQPFQVNIQAAPNQNRRRLTAFGMHNNPNQAAELLFARLDRDSNKRLSREEMEKALPALAKQDLDQDETISTAELVPVNYGRYFVGSSRATASENVNPFLSLGSGTTSRQVASQLTKKYDKNPVDNALSQSELGVSDSLFAEHDIDGNGKWDFEEMQQYLRSPTADVVVKVQLGTHSKSSQTKIEFQHGKELSSEFKNAIGSLNLGTVQMEISVNANSRVKIEDQLKRQFQSVDRDNNGYIDKEESQRLGNANAIFQDLDRDKDEKVFLEEVIEGVLPVAELMMRQIRLNVTDRGKDLFRILDSNGDNRLSRREFWAMPNRADLWDKDGDGQITLTEIPQQYRLVASQGDFSLLSRLNGVVVASPYGTPVSRNNTSGEGPMWFQRMDRNTDGDLSLREFLGTQEDFQKLDEDQDGLISPQEASLAK